MSLSNRTRRIWFGISGIIGIGLMSIFLERSVQAANGYPGIIQESSIASLHAAIKAGEISCRTIIKAYLSRIETYNGQCTKPAPDPRRSISGYTGPLLDGYIGTTRSDHDRETIYGNFEPAKNGQLNAIIVTNVRGKRSSTCKGICDVGGGNALPVGCPAVCEVSRTLPDALQEARRLDRTYGTNPPLDELPLYCIPFSAKDTIDSSQMRSTGGGDAVYAHDRATEDATVVARVRAAGAIVLAQANLSDYNGGSGSPNDLPPNVVGGNGSSIAGHLCNPYDTTRTTGGSSGGSGSSVGANLVVCSFCEETGGSCRNPANVNGAAQLMGSQGFFSKFGLNPVSRVRDRIGVTCRWVDDLARVADAIKGYDAKNTDSTWDFFNNKPTAFVDHVGKVSLEGKRIGIVREHMVPWTKDDEDRVNQFNAELAVLKVLGAELVESVDPEYIARMGDDPAIPNMTLDFNDAIAQILPYYAPSYIFRSNSDGSPEFPSLFDFSSDHITTGVALFFGDLAVPAAISDGHLNLRRLQSFPSTPGEFKHSFNIYLRERGDTKMVDFDAINSDSNFFTDKLLDPEDPLRIDPNFLSDRRQNFEDHAAELTIESTGLNDRIMVREVMRKVMAKVMGDNKLDAFTNPLSTLPPAKLGQVGNPSGAGLRPSTRFPLSADAGTPEVVVPMGFSRIVYDPIMTLNPEDSSRVIGIPGTVETVLPEPGLPHGIAFWAGPGQEAVLLEIASAYETETTHRQPPPNFGPVVREP